jgi:catechol 2,3-dioxygenase-like lactoylglutathione lyase family enzyme
LTLGPLARLELPCRDPHRQREFFGRVLGLPPIGTGATLHFAMGGIELVLRARGDALFPMGQAEAGAPPRLLRIADPEGNVVELFAAP